MPSVVLWSGTAQDPYCREVRASGIFAAIFVPARKGPAQTPAYPISSDRRLLPGCRLSPRCIPWHLVQRFRLALPLHQGQTRSLFRRTSRRLLLKEPYSLLFALLMTSAA